MRPDIIERVKVGITTVDKQGNIVEINSILLDILGSPSAEEEKQYNLLTLPNMAEAGIVEPLRQVIDRTMPFWEGTGYYTSIWGKKSYVEVSILPVSEGAIILVKDLTEVKKLEIEHETSRFIQSLLSELIKTNFKTTINRLLTFLIEWQHSEKSLDQIKDQSNFILEEIKDLNTVIEKVEELSDYNQQQLTLTEIDLVQVLETQIDTLHQVFLGRKIDISFDPPTVRMAVQADKFLQDLFYIILENACVHNDKECVIIEIKVEGEIQYFPDGTERKLITVKIADNGPGIPEETKSKILEPTIGSSPKLGLPMAAILLKRYKGTIKFQDRIVEGSKAGTKVIITLPQG
ncbi:MAG: ATP-binding protein [Candidatus Odinarchaeota archaeon]